MSNRVEPCRRGCGTLIYFDAQSTVGHPSPDKWIPLEYVNNQKTGNPHNCPKRSNGSTKGTISRETMQTEPQKPKDREIDIVAAVEAEPLILTVLKAISSRLDQIVTLMEEDRKEREELK
jgi:hypothetical protein